MSFGAPACWKEEIGQGRIGNDMGVKAHTESVPQLGFRTNTAQIQQGTDS